MRVQHTPAKRRERVRPEPLQITRQTDHIDPRINESGLYRSVQCLRRRVCY